MAEAGPTDAEDSTAEPAPDPAPRRQEIDASVAQILREEAEREAAARASEGLEQQADLGLDSAPEPATTNDATPAGNAAAVAAIAAESRRELLPDIEEINSSLRSAEERGEVIPPLPEELEETQRRGFRLGFFSVLLLIATFWLIYAFADTIKLSAPFLSAPLDAYVDLVDRGRLWIDIKAQEMLNAMEGTTPESAPTAETAEAPAATATEADASAEGDGSQADQ